jgi:hypothetical protein
VADESGTSGLIGRLFRAFSGVLEKYAAEAKAEAYGEVRRVIIGLVAMVMSFVFLLHAAAFGHAAAVATAVYFGAPLHLVLAGVLVFDLTMAMFGLLVARLSIWRPLLPRTRKNLAEIGKVYSLLAG